MNTKTRFISIGLLLMIDTQSVFIPVQVSPSPFATDQTGLPAASALPSNQTSDCVVSSHEGSGFISELMTAGNGTLNMGEVLADLRADVDPSIWEIITDTFFQTMQSTPPNGQIFTILLKSIDTPGITVAVCDDGTVQTVQVYGDYPA